MSWSSWKDSTLQCWRASRRSMRSLTKINHILGRLLLQWWEWWRTKKPPTWRQRWIQRRWVQPSRVGYNRLQRRQLQWRLTRDLEQVTKAEVPRKGSISLGFLVQRVGRRRINRSGANTTFQAIVSFGIFSWVCARMVIRMSRNAKRSPAAHNRSQASRLIRKMELILTGNLNRSDDRISTSGWQRSVLIRSGKRLEPWLRTRSLPRRRRGEARRKPSRFRLQRNLRWLPLILLEDSATIGGRSLGRSLQMYRTLRVTQTMLNQLMCLRCLRRMRKCVVFWNWCKTLWKLSLHWMKCRR